MKRNKFYIIFLLITLLLCSCGNMTNGEFREQKNQPTYSYEQAEAIITEIDMRNWFATTHIYEWSIKVYYELYDLSFEENGWSIGAFNAPIFINKSEGDTVTVEIRNKYISGELTERKIMRIK